jgi:hypothetical protein
LKQREKMETTSDDNRYSNLFRLEEEEEVPAYIMDEEEDIEADLRADFGLTDLPHDRIDIDKGATTSQQFKINIAKEEMSPTLGTGFDDSNIPDESIFSPTNANCNRKKTPY